MEMLKWGRQICSEEIFPWKSKTWATQSLPEGTGVLRVQARTHQRGHPRSGRPECSPSDSALSCHCPAKIYSRTHISRLVYPRNQKILACGMMILGLVQHISTRPGEALAPMAEPHMAGAKRGAKRRPRRMLFSKSKNPFK